MNEALRVETSQKLEQSTLLKNSMANIASQSEKMIKVGEEARVYLAELDMETVNEEAIRETDLSRISSQNHRQVVNQSVADRINVDRETQLGRIGEVFEKETTGGIGVNPGSQRDVKDSVTL